MLRYQRVGGAKLGRILVEKGNLRTEKLDHHTGWVAGRELESLPGLVLDLAAENVVDKAKTLKLENKSIKNHDIMIKLKIKNT